MKIKVRVMHVYVECPRCGEYLEGWMGDPRGVTDECEHCGMKVEIPEDCEIELAAI